MSYKRYWPAIVLFRFSEAFSSLLVYFACCDRMRSTSHPSYVSSSGSSGTDTNLDGDTLMISPNTITANLVDLDQHLELPAAPSLVSQQRQSSLDELAAFEGDPLEWLIENEVTEDEDDRTNSWLPESSLPYFPNLGHGKLGAPTETTHMEVEPEIDHHVYGHSTASDTMVEAAIINNMGDPNVTVQSLFLPGESNVLLLL